MTVSVRSTNLHTNGTSYDLCRLTLGTVSLIRDHLVSADKRNQLSDAELCVSLFIAWRRKSVCVGGGIPIYKSGFIGMLSQSSINHFRGWTYRKMTWDSDLY